jgi:hypothetical protein
MRELMNQGIELAENIENALIDLIRAELQGKDTVGPSKRISALVRNDPHLLIEYEERVIPSRHGDSHASTIALRCYRSTASIGVAYAYVL